MESCDLHQVGGLFAIEGIDRWFGLAAAAKAVA
jgi:hypothetical protein